MKKGASPEERFRKIFASLPINLRAEIIAVVDDHPISWNLAFKEIEHNTKLGNKILKMLEELEII